jgi:hypothetical protein
MANVSSYRLTQAEYNAVKANKFSTACFHQFHTGQNDGFNPVVCNFDGTGNNAQLCSGYTRRDAFGSMCRAMCADSADNGAQCSAAAVTYCAGVGAPNPDCACLNPAGVTPRVWGQGDSAMQWSQLQTFMQNNPAIQSTEEKCFWPACDHSVADAVLGTHHWSDPNVCPNAGEIKCIVRNVTVSISKSKADHLNIINQECGGSGISGSDGGDDAAATWWWAGLPAFEQIAMVAGAIAFAFVVVLALWLNHMFKERRRAGHASDIRLNAALQLLPHAAAAATTPPPPPPGAHAGGAGPWRRGS